MRWNKKYSVETPAPGILIYREGHREFSFPVYEEDDAIVFVVWPTCFRIFLFFFSGGWTSVPKELSKADEERVTKRVVDHFRRGGRAVKIVTRPCANGLDFRPELFEHRASAIGTLESAGFSWFTSYSSIELLHEEFGLEVCGIRKEHDVEPILETLNRLFPQWHNRRICFENCDRESRWKAAVHLFPQRACGGGQCVDVD